jgi:ATP-binding cassette subfamily C (CFTR/MRP) protein 1
VALYNTSKFGEEKMAVYQYLSPCCRFASAILAVVLLQWNRKKGIRSAGTLIIFWLLMTVYGAVKFRTYLLIHIYGSSEAVVTSSVLFGTATVDMITFVVLLCLSCIPDQKPAYNKLENMNASPECWAPFLSQITFWWMNGLFVTGYKRPLSTDDLWSLLPEEKTSTVSAKLLSEWQKEIQKAKSKGKQNKFLAETDDIQLMSLNEKTDLEDANDTSDASVLLQVHDMKQTKLKKPSLLRAMARSFGRELFFEVVLKLIQDILLFVSPQLLKLLIEFTLDESIPPWHGYVYASLLFAVTEVKSIVVHQYFHLCNKTGLHARVALMDAVYRKSLQLSNSARRKATVGEIVNLMAVDAHRFYELAVYMHTIWSAPLQICLATVFLWQNLGPSVLAGIAVVLLLIPINSGIAGITRKMQV